MRQFEMDKLQELDHMKSRFFANISHEIRTPLTLILGPIEQLVSEARKEKWKNQLHIMSRNAHNLLGLINQLLDFSKLESGQMILKARELNIVPLLRGMVYSFDSLARRKQITLDFTSVEEEIPVYIDTEKLEKIMANLLSNAFKYTSEGGKISVQLSYLQPAYKMIEVRVVDTGIGIAQEHLDPIFERYFRVDKKNEQTGTGIGLALTKELVELHHGRISVQSEQGKGSVFIIHLPLGKEHLAEDDMEMDMVKETKLPPAGSFQEQIDANIEEAEKTSDDRIELIKENKERPGLLIVEDTEDVRNYLRGFLEPHYQIEEASDGDEGVEKAIESLPDLIISDVMMPKMDGFQLCEKLKTDERTSHIPVIILTARAAESSKLAGLETGADDYLVKPFSAKELTIRIKNLIEQRRKMRERFSRDITLSPKDISVTSADERFLNRAIEIIEKNMGDPDFGVDAFGKEIALSHTQLYRKLKALTNQSPVYFIRTIRLKRAAGLLEQAYGNVAEISYEVGFNNPSYFAECFRKQFGKPPSEYTSGK
jgi:DNA-binding response OmpR family regulator/two-component sensor histidine kinase